MTFKPLLSLLAVLTLSHAVASAQTAPICSFGTCARAPAATPQDPCLRVRIALDIGSRSSKARSGVVNVCLQKLVAEIARRSTPINFGNKIAANPMRRFVLEQFKRTSAFKPDGSPVSPNPILPRELDAGERALQTQRLIIQARTFASGHLRSLLEAGWMTADNRAARGRQVYGIGGVHNGLFGMVRQLNGADLRSYSREDLDRILEKALTADNASLIAAFKAKADFALGAVTNILLVRSVMEVLQIDRVIVLDVDNTYGAMIAPAFWTGDNAGANAVAVNP